MKKIHKRIPDLLDHSGVLRQIAVVNDLTGNTDVFDVIWVIELISQQGDIYNTQDDLLLLNHMGYVCENDYVDGSLDETSSIGEAFVELEGFINDVRSLLRVNGVPYNVMFESIAQHEMNSLPPGLITFNIPSPVDTMKKGPLNKLLSGGGYPINIGEPTYSFDKRRINIPISVPCEVDISYEVYVHGTNSNENSGLVHRSNKNTPNDVSGIAKQLKSWADMRNESK